MLDTSRDDENNLDEIVDVSAVGTENDMFDCFNRRGLHFIHVNARSLLPKLEGLKLLASNTQAAVVAVTETWLDGSIEDDEVELPGYSVHRIDGNRNCVLLGMMCLLTLVQI